PLRFIDPDGMAVEEVNGGVRYTGKDAAEAFSQIKTLYMQKGEKPVENIEEKVRRLINDGNYGDALNSITSYFSNEFNTPADRYDYNYTDNPKADWETLTPIKNQNDELTTTIMVPIRDLTNFAAGKTSFGQLVRNLWHEHYHVKQRTGLLGEVMYDQAEREFIANYKSITNSNLTQSTADERKFYLKWAYEKNYYNAMSEDKKEKYKKEYEHLKEMYDMEVRGIKPKPKKAF